MEPHLQGVVGWRSAPDSDKDHSTTEDDEQSLIREDKSSHQVSLKNHEDVRNGGSRTERLRERFEARSENVKEFLVGVDEDDGRRIVDNGIKESSGPSEAPPEAPQPRDDFRFHVSSAGFRDSLSQVSSCFVFI